MLLAIDVGNTEISFGVFRGSELAADWRLASVGHRTPDEWRVVLRSHLSDVGLSDAQIDQAVIGSVAPTVAEPLRTGVRNAFGVEPIDIRPDSGLPVTLDVDEPRTVGADRIVNTLAAVHLYHTDTIVVDFGTATTFDCITEDSRFIGGVIAPGLRTAAEDLALRAAKIPVTSLVRPTRVIGRTTEQCVRAGVFFGAADAADGIVRRIKAEWPTDVVPRVVATGGLAPMIQSLSSEIGHVEPHLTLIGLRISVEYLVPAAS